MSIDQKQLEEILELGKFQGMVIERLRGIDENLRDIKKLSLESIGRSEKNTIEINNLKQLATKAKDIEEAFKASNEKIEENTIDINKLRAWGFVIVVVLSLAFGYLGDYVRGLFGK